MNKTSKIKSIEFKSEWPNPRGGVVYYHNIEFENGDKGDIGTKEKDSLRVGDEIEYTVQSTDKGNKIKKVSSFQGGGGGGQYKRQDDPATRKRIVRSVCIECAIKYRAITQHTDKLTDIANTFEAWVETKGTDQGQNISAQASLSRAVTYVEFEGNVEEQRNFADYKKFIPICENIFKYITS